MSVQRYISSPESLCLVSWIKGAAIESREVARSLHAAFDWLSSSGIGESSPLNQPTRYYVLAERISDYVKDGARDGAGSRDAATMAHSNGLILSRTSPELRRIHAEVWDGFNRLTTVQIDL